MSRQVKQFLIHKTLVAFLIIASCSTALLFAAGQGTPDAQPTIRSFDALGMTFEMQIMSPGATAMICTVLLVIVVLLRVATRRTEN